MDHSFANSDTSASLYSVDKFYIMQQGSDHWANDAACLLAFNNAPASVITILSNGCAGVLIPGCCAPMCSATRQAAQTAFCSVV